MGRRRHGRIEPHPGQRAKDNPNFFVALASTSRRPLPAADRRGPDQGPAGNVLGAVGASGGTGDEDEAICIAGVEAAGLQAG